jgi:hypothetical protein
LYFFHEIREFHLNKLAYQHLQEVRDRQEELELLASDLLEAIGDAEARYNILKEKGGRDE